MDSDKFHFLKEEFVPLLQTLDPHKKGLWGVMNAQQMVEHFAEAVKVASGQLELPSIDDKERIAKNQGFLMTEIPFKENTKNPLLSEIPPPARHATMNDSITELQKDLNHFFKENELFNLTRPTLSIIICGSLSVASTGEEATGFLRQTIKDEQEDLNESLAWERGPKNDFNVGRGMILR